MESQQNLSPRSTHLHSPTRMTRYKFISPQRARRLLFVVIIAAVAIIAISLTVANTSKKKSNEESTASTHTVEVDDSPGSEEVSGDGVVSLSGANKNDRFGTSVSLSKDGTRLAVGAYGYARGVFTQAGSCTVYERTHVDDTNGDSWVALGKPILGESPGDFLGSSVALNGDGTRVAVGAPTHGEYENGIAQVFEYVVGNNEWQRMGESILGDDDNDNTGTSVALSEDGSVVAVGSPGSEITGEASGHVSVFQFLGDGWHPLGQQINGVGDDMAGSSVALSKDGKIVAVGMPNGMNPPPLNQNGAGRVQVYHLDDDGKWVQHGQTVYGTMFDDKFGTSVALSDEGDTLLVGSPGRDFQTGRVQLFVYHDDGADEGHDPLWVERGTDLNGETPGDEFGKSVSLSSKGDIAAVGAWQEKDRDLSGHCQIHKIDQGVWTKLGETVDGKAGSHLGASVSLSGDGSLVAVGAPTADGGTGGGLEMSGEVRVQRVGLP